MKVRHIYNSLIPKALKVDAITLYPFICYALDEDDVTDELIAHEVCHFLQVEDVGFFRFYISYLLFYVAFRLSGLNHEEAYLDIPYEVEARETEWIGSVFGKGIKRGNDNADEMRES